MPDEKRRRGRPPHQPTDESRALVVAMVSRGAPVEEIARAVGVAESTLRGHYRAELATPRPQAALPGIAPPDPQPPRPNSGRPEHVASEETRERVAILSAARMPAWQIARAIGISEPTLRFHYAEALETGAAAKRAQVIESIFREAASGNTSAARTWLGIQGPLDDPPPPEPEEEKLGKKEQAQRAALTATMGSAWDGLLPH